MRLSFVSAFALLCAAHAAAQGEYNVAASFDAGYRFHAVGGNESEYRSNVNYGNGPRLLAGSLLINTQTSRYFDQISLTVSGLGNDPYQSAILRVRKRKLYRYDLMWRQNAYFNPGLVTDIAAGTHLLDTTYSLQDHDLTLFPDSNLKFFFGYSRSLQSGAGISTVQLFDSRGSIVPLFANVHRLRNEYRLGNEFRLLGIRVNWLRGWDDFKEDSPLSLVQPTATVTDFARTEPYHGTSPYWRVGLFAGRKWLSINGRLTYTSGQRQFVNDETARGLATFNAPANRQILSFGTARRPVATGNLTVSVALSKRLTIVNQTSVYNIRTEGNSDFLQLNNNTQQFELLNFQYLGIRSIATDTQANWQATDWLGFYAGYQYTNRRIRSIQQEGVPGFDPDSVTGDQTNQLHSGLFGMRLRPLPGLTVNVDGEIGRADTPFTPVSERNYQTLGARLQYTRKSLRVTAYTKANYNNNATTLTAYSSHARSYSANASWNPRPWLGFDAGYSKLHLDTLGGIAYFVNFQQVNGTSLYISNIHSGNAGARLNYGSRADLYVGYSHTEDTGDGRSAAGTDPFGTAQTFPLRFATPQARVSFRLREKLRWVAMYQYYGYREQFFSRDNYRAHTGFTGLSFSF